MIFTPTQKHEIRHGLIGVYVMLKKATRRRLTKPEFKIALGYLARIQRAVMDRPSWWKRLKNWFREG